jgi:vancomycin permeability regulator SanA
MLKQILRIILITGMVALFLPRLITHLYALSRTYRSDNVPARPVAIVFGAGLWRDGSPTPVLRDRVATAADLFFAGKVDKILLSGDNPTDHYDEPGAMRDYALNLGVPEDAVILDYAGRRTYDTCYRARHIFGIERAILITQNFHMPRTIYTCNSLGVSAVGVPANQRTYRQASLFYWNMREVFATFIAFTDIHLTKPLPVLGKPEPIFSQGA